MADGKDLGDTTGSIRYSDADLKYFIDQLEKTGRYEVRSRTSTPSADLSMPKMEFGTPTPVKDYYRRVSSLGAAATSVSLAPKPYRSLFSATRVTSASAVVTSAVASTGYGTQSLPSGVQASSLHSMPKHSQPLQTSSLYINLPSYSQPVQTSLYTMPSYSHPVQTSSRPFTMPTYSSYVQTSSLFTQSYASTLPVYTRSDPVTYTVPHDPYTPYSQYPKPSVSQYIDSHHSSSTSLPPQKFSLVPYPDLSKTIAAHGDSQGGNNRVPRLPDFSGGTGRDTVEFEVWKYDVRCLVKEQVYSHFAILEAIRRSLKGKARGVLLHVGELPQISDIIDELEGIYGNVSSSEKIKEQFYSAQQVEGESLADYSVRLEKLLVKTDMQLKKSQRDEMLCGRLWSGLKSTELKNMARFKYETVKDFNTLRREIRQIEENMKTSPISLSHLTNEQKSSTEHATQQMTLVEHKLLQQLQELNGQMKDFNSRVEVLERNAQPNQPDKENAGGWQNTPSGGQNNQKGGRYEEKGDRGGQKQNQNYKKWPANNQKDKGDLNAKGSSSKGSR